jgi:hypothetical protein
VQNVLDLAHENAAVDLLGQRIGVICGGFRRREGVDGGGDSQRRRRDDGMGWRCGRRVMGGVGADLLRHQARYAHAKAVALNLHFRQIKGKDNPMADLLTRLDPTFTHAAREALAPPDEGT